MALTHEFVDVTVSFPPAEGGRTLVDMTWTYPAPDGRFRTNRFHWRCEGPMAEATYWDICGQVGHMVSEMLIRTAGVAMEIPFD